MYDPELGRFIQEDTYKGEQNDPLSLNLYTYCKNNPLIYNDPTGHWPQFLKKAAQKVKSVAKKVIKTTASVVKGVYEFAKEAIVGAVGIVKGVYKFVKDPVGTMKDLKKTAVNVWNTAKYIYKNPSVIADMASQNWQEFKNASLEDKVKMITKTGLSIMPAGKVLSANKLANVASKVGKITDKLNDISKGSSKLAKAIKYTNKVRKTAQSTVKKGKSELKSIKNAVLGKTKSSGGVSIVDNKIVNNVNSKGEKVLDLPGNLKEAKCFVAGTKVSSEDGLKPIEKIKIGDRVWSKNEETGEVALKKVKNIFVNKTKVLVHVIINGEEIKATEKHPFYVEGKGWVVASELNCGDIVIREDGSKAKVESVKTEKLEKEIEVYNFEVEDFHTYFVGENRILVHNTCGIKPVDEVVDGAGNATGSYKQLVDAGEKDAHHIIQDAAMREIDGYNRFSAPSIQLDGPSRIKGTPHNIATSIQRQAGGGTYGAERRIGYKALRRAGLSVDDAKSAVRGADKYFMDELGLTLDSPTRIPGNRRGR